MTDTSTAAIAALLEGVTPGPWRIGSWGDNVFGTGPNDEWLPICRVKRDDAPIEESTDARDARFIAAARDLVPALVAERDAEKARADAATLRFGEAAYAAKEALDRAEAAEAERDCYAGLRDGAEAALAAEREKVARLTEALRDIIAQEDKAWKPMQIFRSDQQVAMDEARHEAWIEAAKIARAALEDRAHG